MAKPIHHALNSARKFGGKPEDTLALHHKMDSSKCAYPKMAHRLVFHSEEGISLLAEIMKDKPDGFIDVARQHIDEDLGFIPRLEDWSCEFDPQNPWLRAPRLGVEHHCELDARRWGGEPAESFEIHEFIHDWTETAAGRAIFFSAFGCYLVEERFGFFFENSAGKWVATRDIAEQHVLRTLSCIPPLCQWLDPINKPWMAGQRTVSFVIVD